MRVLPVVLIAACAQAGGDDSPPGAADARRADASLPDPPDAEGPPRPQIVWVGPEDLFVPRGSSATLGVNLDLPAGPGGLVLTVDSDDPGGYVSHAPSVMVAEGQSSAEVVVQGVALGGPVDIAVSLGTSMREAQAQVVPAIRSLTAPGPELVVGETMSLTITLESAPAIDVDLLVASSNAFLVSAPTVATVPAGSATGTVEVTGEDLGGVVQIVARLGDANATTPIRVGGLYLSEILYDVAGADDDREWIEIYNATNLAIPMAGLKLQLNNGATSGFVDVMALSGGIAPGACVVVGGPLTGAAAANFTPDGFAYEITEDFTTDLGNAGDPSDVPQAPADAIQLILGTGIVLDSVIYGRNNSGSMTDEDGGVPPSPEAPDADPGQSIERTTPGVSGPWRAQATPNPGNCSAIAP